MTLNIETREIISLIKNMYLRTNDENDRVQMNVERNIYRKMCRSKKESLVDMRQKDSLI